MKRTAFYKFHESLEAKIVPFAGFEMPVEYSGINNEHMTVRNGVGVFDVSHMGEFWVKGPKAFDLVQKVTTNDVAALSVGQAQYSCFPNGKGGIVDDLLVYKYEEEKYLLVVNASNIDKDWAWVSEQNTMGAEIENASDAISQLAIQGPKATAVLQKLTDIDLLSIPYYTFQVGAIAGVENVIISNTGYTGSGGFELYIYNDDADKAWEAIFKAGEEEGILPIGLAARDTLRLEKGFCLYGNDIDETTTSIEAGLGWITKFNDQNNFIDKEYLLKQKEEGVSRRLRGFVLEDRGIPRKDYEVVTENDEVIGRVTSGTMSPMLQKGIGMAYINKGYTKFDTEIFIKVRNRKLKAKVVKLPFV
ncbi:glycine cleavage system aminomethyltransferase GcvT [Carboxylicivirga sp. M1479]|uniref:glycine cleavage system aminomethyltransferase GcvT n=1 Tax=Carboxylicivirga sp. M1479 TaxID=2594476 RepID=UPI00117827F2|nr:glycine cleavage system aminomethyltransferase GcvT [Carboxylicivirga sp. M1479]TRX70658.1 glycine cleavage system aminomethyltransferase GcvT [Carboxylicivirga sp. M1479]